MALHSVLAAALLPVFWAAGSVPVQVQAAAPTLTAPLPPGQTACPGTFPAAVQAVPDLSGYGGSGVENGPVSLGPAALVYLDTSRRPIPRVTALVARTLRGRTLWRLPLAPGADPTNVTALDGRLVLAVRQGADSLVEARSPGDGRIQGTVSLPWPAHTLAPLATALPRGDLLLSGSPLDLPDDLGGLGRGTSDAWLLGPGLRVLWHVSGIGRLLAVGPDTALFGRLEGAQGRTIDLTAIALRLGTILWTRSETLPAAPDLSGFSAPPSAPGRFLWTVAWPGGARLSLLAAYTGRTVWSEPTRRTRWLAAGSLVLGGALPWQRPLGLEARDLATGRRIWTATKAAFPVAEIGSRVLVATAGPTGGSPTAPQLGWVTPGTNPAITPTAVAAGAPPYTLTCAPSGVQVLTPWVTGSVATVGTSG